MTIPNVSEELLREVLKDNLTPSDTIRSPERLFGRDRSLVTIDRALNSAGRQIFVHGDRGVGKTSLALTAAYLHAATDSPPIYVMCGTNTTFSQAILSVGHATIDIEARVDRPRTGGGLNLSLPAALGGGGVGFSRSNKQAPALAAPENLNDALDIVRYVASKRKSPTIVVMDEMERIDPAELSKFAEFIKNVPELANDVRFIFCGIAHDVNELLQSHPSAGRVLETVKLDRLHHSDLWKILTVVGDKLGVEIQREALIRISQISDGFPHYVHLIGESLFWSMYDDTDSVTKSGPSHFKAGVNGALQRTEATLRAQYEKATRKYRATADYEDALWALADSTSDSRQITEVYDASYKWISQKQGSRSKLPREKLNQRYLALKKESHGRLVIGHGSGWFSFRESIMRGYVRLRAEAGGINLGKYTSTAGMV